MVKAKFFRVIGKIRLLISQKECGCFIAFACSIISAIIIFFGIGFVAVTHSSQQNHFMMWLCFFIGVAVFVTGIVFYFRGKD